MWNCLRNGLAIVGGLEVARTFLLWYYLHNSQNNDSIDQNTLLATGMDNVKTYFCDKFNNFVIFAVEKFDHMKLTLDRFFGKSEKQELVGAVCQIFNELKVPFQVIGGESSCLIYDQNLTDALTSSVPALDDLKFMIAHLMENRYCSECKNLDHNFSSSGSVFPGAFLSYTDDYLGEIEELTIVVGSHLFVMTRQSDGKWIKEIICERNYEKEKNEIFRDSVVRCTKN